MGLEFDNDSDAVAQPESAGRVEALNTDRPVRIRIIGVGGAGNNAVDRLKLENLSSVNLAVINTDTKTLSASPIEEKLHIGRAITMGLSAGGEADIGREAALADEERIARLVSGTDLVFILAGLGGGTGSGASPVIAEVAARQGAVVIAFVTMPFSREGARRHKQADHALAQMREHCHAVITLPNDLLLQQVDEDATVMEAFAIADEWIQRGVESVCSLLFQSGLINVDFATLKQAFQARGGKTLFGIGYGEGENYIEKALRDLDMCPLLHTPENRYVRRADSLILNITGGPDLSIARVNEIMDYVSEKFGSRNNTVLGAVIDGGMAGRVRISVIGTTDLGPPRKGYAPVAAASLPSNRSATASAAIERSESRAAEMPTKVGARGKAMARARDQVEFDFPAEDEHRGFFEKTERNLYEGEDLDIPTFFRRGIKIPR